MAMLLYVEGWALVVLALIAAVACGRHVSRLTGSKRMVLQTKSVTCFIMALILALGLLRWLDVLTSLALLLSCLASLLLSLIVREVIDIRKRP